jgi:hypothetical protein
MASRCEKFTLIAVFIPCTSDFPGQSASAGQVPPDACPGSLASFKTFEASPFLASSIAALTQNGPVLNAYTYRSILSVLSVSKKHWPFAVGAFLLVV